MLICSERVKCRLVENPTHKKGYGSDDVRQPSLAVSALGLIQGLQDSRSVFIFLGIAKIVELCEISLLHVIRNKKTLEVADYPDLP